MVNFGISCQNLPTFDVFYPRDSCTNIAFPINYFNKLIVFDVRYFTPYSLNPDDQKMKLGKAIALLPLQFV